MLGIRIKLILIMGVLIMIIGTSSCLFFLIYTKRQQEDAHKRLGISLVMMLAQDNEVKHALNYDQPAFLDAPINRIRMIDREEEICYWRISDMQKVLVEEKVPWINIDMKEIPDKKDAQTMAIPDNQRMWTRGGPKDREISQKLDVSFTNCIITRTGDVFRDFAVPVYEKQTFSEEVFAAEILGENDITAEKTQQILGFVQIGLSPEKLNKRIHKIIWQSIIPMGIGIVVAGICITIFLTRYFVSPLKHIASVTLDIARGDLTRIIEVQTKDEVGQLSKNFNQMTKALKASYDEKEKIMAQLREHVNSLFMANKELVKINEQLNEAQERLVRSEKLAAVGKLASGVGHELRNPLGAVKNALFIIKKKIANAGMLNDMQKLNQLIAIIEKETERSIKTVNDLMGFSRTAKPTVAPAGIHSIVESSLLRVNIPEKIKKVIQLEKSLPLILVDASQIEQVFINLIQNACDAMPAGGQLTIHAQEEKDFLTVTVTDTGCGISGEIKNKIFDPLFTTKQKGIGLGLAVCESIIHKHEGYIDLESKVGVGTSFIIKLPLVKSKEAKSQAFVEQQVQMKNANI